MKNFTRKQLGHVISMHDYIAVRWIDGCVTGMSCKAAQIVKKQYPMDNVTTRIIGFYPISFQEYIRIKTPYL